MSKEPKGEKTVSIVIEIYKELIPNPKFDKVQYEKDINSDVPQFAHNFEKEFFEKTNFVLSGEILGDTIRPERIINMLQRQFN